MSATYKTGPRAVAARQIRRVSSAVWKLAKLDEVRYLTAADLAVIQIVGRIDHLANLLDRPW